MFGMIFHHLRLFFILKQVYNIFSIRWSVCACFRVVRVLLHKHENGYGDCVSTNWDNCVCLKLAPLLAQLSKKRASPHGTSNTKPSLGATRQTSQQSTSSAATSFAAASVVTTLSVSSSSVGCRLSHSYCHFPQQPAVPSCGRCRMTNRTLELHSSV